MISEVVTTATVDEHGLHLRHKDRFIRDLRQLYGEVEVIARRKRATRSDSQNKWYWGCIVEGISEHTGYTPDEVHELLKAKFIPKKLAIADGNGEIKDEFVIGGTTTRLNKLEFGEYCEAIRQWAAQDLDIVIPDPEGGLSR